MHGVRSAADALLYSPVTFFYCSIDVEIHHLETPTPLEFSHVRVIAEGPLRAAVQTQVKFGKSTIDVTVRI